MVIVTIRVALCIC